MSLSTSMPAVVFLSFGLTGLVNPLLKRLDLQAGLRHPELVLVFTMMAMASPIPTFFTVRFLSQIVDPFYFASPIMLELSGARGHYVWWPIYPQGYPVGPIWIMDHPRFNIFLAWEIKVTVLKYGGV